MMNSKKKSELSESAHAKLKGLVEQSVENALEKKLHDEMKKVTKALTIKFIVSGVAMVGALVLINNADKIVSLLIKKDK